MEGAAGAPCWRVRPLDLVANARPGVASEKRAERRARRARNGKGAWSARRGVLYLRSLACLGQRRKFTKRAKVEDAAKQCREFIDRAGLPEITVGSELISLLHVGRFGGIRENETGDHLALR